MATTSGNDSAVNVMSGMTNIAVASGGCWSWGIGVDVVLLHRWF
jgi:hypothetical protein